MKVTDLTGADLALWVARVEGNLEPFKWVNHAGKTLVYLHPTDRDPYMPHEDWRDTGPLLRLLLGASCVLIQHEATGPVSVVGPFGGYRGATAQEAICRARVGLRYGEEVPDLPQPQQEG